MVLRTLIRCTKFETQFDKVFSNFNKEVLHWFPGHMDAGLKRMQQKLLTVDCIIEVHDARIPFSGRNPAFMSSLIAIRPHILVMNKKDLCDQNLTPRVHQKLKREEKINNVVYTNCKDQRCTGLKKIFPMMQELIERSDRFNRANKNEYNIMVIGVPNVGKSSLLNVLRNLHLNKRSATAVGAIPGITRSVLTRIKISENPPIYVFDTPGITTPYVPHLETGMKMALCNIMVDHLVGDDLISKYLLFWMNKFERFEYVKYLGLDGPSESITEILVKLAVKRNKYIVRVGMDNIKKMYPDIHFAAKEFNKAFREGALGKFVLDKDLL